MQNGISDNFIQAKNEIYDLSEPKRLMLLSPKLPSIMN